MMNLTANEIKVLKYLADDNENKSLPEGITQNLQKMICRELKDKGLVWIADSPFGFSAGIEDEGRGALDEIASEEKYILKQILKEYKIHINGFECLRIIKRGEDPHNYLERVDFIRWGVSYYILIRNDGKYVLRTEGEELVDDIEDELCHRLTLQSSSRENNVDSEEKDKQITQLKKHLEELDKENTNLKERVYELENGKKNRTVYHFQITEGKVEEISIGLRERIVIMLAVYRKGLLNKKEGDMSLGFKCLVGNKKTVTDYLNDMKPTGKNRLKEEEKAKIRKILCFEGIDSSYILDYLN